MTKKLSLNEEQQMKVEDINIKYAFQRLDMYEAIKKATNNGTTLLQMKHELNFVSKCKK
jgi:hypothetical protein